MSDNEDVTSDDKANIREFLKRVQQVDNEIETLKEDRKALVDEFKERFDMKTLQTALRVLKLENSVAHKSTYDEFMEILKEV